MLYPQDVRIDRPGRVLAALTATLALVAVMLPGVPVPAGAAEPDTVLAIGTVEDGQGDPVEDATVQLALADLSVTTDAAGTFMFDEAPVGSDTLVISADGFESFSQAVTVTDDPAGHDFGTVELDPEPSVDPTNFEVEPGDGELHASWDAPPGSFENYELSWSAQGDDNWDMVELDDDVTSHTIDGLDNDQPYEVRIRTRNDGTWVSAGFVVPEALEDVTATFVVEDDTTDEPIEGATVEIDGHSEDTNTDGEAVIQLTPGAEDLELVVSADGYETSEESLGELQAGPGSEFTYTISLDPVETGDVTINVTSAAGNPVTSGSVSFGPHTGTTNLDGTVEFSDVEAGDHMLSVTAAYYQQHTSTETVEAGEVTTIDVELETSPGTIDVWVYDDDSNPAEGADVEVVETGDTATTGTGGTTGFSLPAGDYTVTVELDGHEPYSTTTTVTVMAPAFVYAYLDAATTGDILVNVTDVADQSIIDGAAVFVDGDEVATHEGSSTRVEDLEPGTYDVHVEADGYEDADTKEVEVEAGETTHISFPLDAVEDDPEPDTGTVVGTVTDTDGDPIGDATVSIAGGTTTTGEDGTFELDGVDAGTHEVVVTTDGHTHGHTEVEVTAGDTTTVADVVLTAVEMALACDAHDGAVAPGDHVECVIAGLPAGQEGSVTVTLNPTLLDERFAADGDGNAELAFGVPDDATGDDEITIAVALDEVEADATFTLDIVEPDVTTVAEPDDGEQLPRTGLDLLLLVLLSAATMAAGGTALRLTSRA